MSCSLNWQRLELAENKLVTYITVSQSAPLVHRLLLNQYPVLTDVVCPSGGVLQVETDRQTLEGSASVPWAVSSPLPLQSQWW